MRQRLQGLEAAHLHVLGQDITLIAFLRAVPLKGEAQRGRASAPGLRDATRHVRGVRAEPLLRPDGS